MVNVRIKASMSLVEVVEVMSRGNMGAMRVCVDTLKMGNAIDPQAWSTLAHILDLDTLGIYEDRIWILYKYVCNEDLGKMLAVIRAWQLGQLAGITQEVIHHAIEQRGGIDLDAVVNAVKERLPGFNPEAALEQQPSS